ncbi:MAG: acyltransferase [Dehalococcoidales bacterium]|nr:acyltransferase [Dehalococcoidales bacterium]
MGDEEPRYTEYGLTQWYWLVRHRENFKLGRNVEIGCFTIIGCEYGVEIQDDVKIGYHCTIMSDSTVDNKQGKVLLKRGCKIGANSVIMPNITIGENAVVGANSFVNKSIPDNEVWAGTPAKRLKKLR